LPLPGRTEATQERKSLVEIRRSLEQAAQALKTFRKTDRVRERGSVRKSAKAFKKLLAGTNAEADFLLQTWVAVVENGSGRKKSKS
jgi:hypothetical protein